ncbi:MAG TPA: ATP-binding protein [Blastocatellia bacterium]|nr:ATP-binding protein [Blastocatellia bacterium]
MNATSPLTKISWWSRLSLRTRLFIASALLSTAILLVAAVVINILVVRQARQQVQAEVENLLPVYNAIWEENARSLSSIGTTMANSPIAKVVFGNARAAQDRATIHELVADLTSDMTASVDLILLSDGAGKVTFLEIQGQDALPINDLAAARTVAETQQQAQGIAQFSNRLYQLAVTPILTQSGDDQVQNTLAVLATGAELNRAMAATIKKRINSDVVFWLTDRIYASSLEPPAETQVAQLMNSSRLDQATPTRSMELTLEGKESLAFARPLMGFEGQRLGSVVMIRSLEEAGRLFQTISNSLLLLWSLSVAAAFALSYLLAGRITRPIEPLIQSTREVGQGHYDHKINVEATGELGELAQAFDQMRRSLKQSQAELLKRERLATIGQMASSIVHDLRNPLAAIATAAEMLNRDDLALERRKTLVESQLRAAMRMQEMLRELLDFTRGNYSLDLEHHRLLRIIERALQTVPAARTGVVVDIQVAPDLIVTADGERMRRVFENLLSNAVQAMTKQTTERRITICALPHSSPDEARSWLRVEVKDSGPGVPPEIRDRLFEPFVSHGKLGGTGLGLAIARSIIEAHGGSIGLESHAANGQPSETNFYFLLPLVPQ